MQAVFAVRGNPARAREEGPFRLDCFEILVRLDGAAAFCTRAGWNAVRQAAGRPTYLHGLE
ncbi:MAG: hypothetical protein AB1726_16930 [Planctomycetota bacterium]